MLKNINKIKFYCTSFFMVFVLFAKAQYVPQNADKSVGFVIKNLGSKVNGSLSELAGSINFNPEKLDTSNITVTVNTATINTGNKTRDRHLKKDEYFDVEKFPTITIKSNEIVKGNAKDSFYLKGIVTIKGVAQEIILPFVTTKSSAGLVFTGSFAINRRDFGVGKKSAILADKVSITLNITAVKK
jgi:polyisoprenoid-binding protein YceI